jgi:hypothetical protein
LNSVDDITLTDRRDPGPGRDLPVTDTINFKLNIQAGGRVTASDSSDSYAALGRSSP